MADMTEEQRDSLRRRAGKGDVGYVQVAPADVRALLDIADERDAIRRMLIETAVPALEIADELDRLAVSESIRAQMGCAEKVEPERCCRSCRFADDDDCTADPTKGFCADPEFQQWESRASQPKACETCGGLRAVPFPGGQGGSLPCPECGGSGNERGHAVHPPVCRECDGAGLVPAELMEAPHA